MNMLEIKETERFWKEIKYYIVQSFTDEINY